MNDKNQLVAYLATLFALVAVFLAAVIAASIQPGIMGRMEVFGLGTITGGLIGVLRLPTRGQAPDPSVPQSVTVNNDPANPVPVEPAN